jgi:hypothetical protein
MRMLRWISLAVATILVVTPATAQRYDPRYPVCFEGKRGDSMIIDCSYTSLDQCRMTAAGLGATCYANPYWSQANQASPARASPANAASTDPARPWAACGAAAAA